MAVCGSPCGLCFSDCVLWVSERVPERGFLGFMGLGLTCGLWVQVMLLFLSACCLLFGAFVVILGRS